MIRCDGNDLRLDRRTLLRAGLGGLVGALAARTGLAGPAGLAEHLVLVWLKGGASQLETFDPKPGAVTGGPTRALDTAVRGLTFAEHLPLLAERARKLCVVRSLGAREGDHDRASTLLHTGFAPSLAVAYPGVQALVAAERPAGATEGAQVPPFVLIGDGSRAGAGYLGAEHAPFRLLKAGQGVAGAEVGAAGVDAARRAARRELLGRLEAGFARAGGLRPGADGAPSARAGACAAAERLLSGPFAAALDLQKEDAATRARYGDGDAGAGLLLARRLVDAGVRAVEVVVDGWDDHEQLFARLPARAGALDRALAALLDDLEGSGRLGKTLVLVAGEFGRTPEINERGGRDHHPRTNAALLFGGGLAAGRVVGSTTPDGRDVATRPVSTADLAATVLTRFGIAADAKRLAGDRPVTVTDGGTPIAELLG